jgi:hypothetical protein
MSDVRAGLGMAHLLLPGGGARLLVGRPLDGRPRSVVRILGARQLIQAVVTRLRPTATVLTLGAWVDGAHAASMVALAWGRPQWRRAALTEAVTAAGLAVAGSAAAKHERRRTA